MGNTAKKAAKKAAPRTRPQPAASPYAGTVPLPGAAGLPDAGMVAPPIGATADDPYALVGWGESSGINTSGEDLRCPSGQLALVKRPGVQGLIEAGILHDVDSLTGLVDQKHLKRVKGGAQDMSIDAKKLMNDPKSLAKVMGVVDKVLVHVVIKPRLTLAWTEGAEGEQVPLDHLERGKAVEAGAKVFTDQVEIDDKMFIFNYAVGGTRNLERFRQQSDDAVGGVDSGEQVADATE